MGHKILFVGTITPELNIGKLKDFVKKIVYIGVIDLVGHFLIGIPAIFLKIFTNLRLRLSVKHAPGKYVYDFYAY